MITQSANWLVINNGWLAGIYDYAIVDNPPQPPSTDLINIKEASAANPQGLAHYTMLLSPETHDLMLDANGNMALCAQPYAIAQDVACAIRLELGELWYDTTKGMPFLSKIAGQSLPMSRLKAYIETAALTVPDVVKAVCTFDTFTKRNVTGQCLVTDINGLSFGVVL